MRTAPVTACTRTAGRAGSVTSVRVSTCSAELLTVYIDDSESALGIDCPLVRVQQGGSKAVKTDCGLLPDFHLRLTFTVHRAESTDVDET